MYTHARGVKITGHFVTGSTMEGYVTLLYSQYLHIKRPPASTLVASKWGEVRGNISRAREEKIKKRNK
jgi:hypothetical protein